MGIEVVPVRQHWNYFLALEDDIVRMSRYMELCEHNFGAYSIELARIVITAASEVDVVAKLLCKKVDPKSKAERINGYRKTIVPAYPGLPNTLVHLPKFGLTLIPWEEWGMKRPDGTDSNPFWWAAYINVKHKRHDKYADASLKHALNAVAGLYLLLLYLYEDGEKFVPISPDPILFQPGDTFQIDHLMFGQRTALYRLTDAVSKGPQMFHMGSPANSPTGSSQA